VINCNTGNMAAHYHGRPETRRAAIDLAALSAEYNNAPILVLKTGVGMALLLALQEEGAPLWADMVNRQIDGTSVTQSEAGLSASSEYLLDETLIEMVSMLADGGSPRCIVNDPDTLDEMTHYVLLPKGKRGGEGKWHDDRVKSWGGCVWYCNNQTLTPSMRKEFKARAAKRNRERVSHLPNRTRWRE
jgi:hypothetical protein